MRPTRSAVRTSISSEPNAALIQEILGGDTLVRDLNWDACRAANSTLARVPRDRTKAYKNLNLAQAIARAEAEGRLGSPLSRSSNTSERSRS